SRSFAQAIGRTKPQAQRQSVSVGHVDVEFLHQPGGTGPLRQTEKRPATSQARIAQGVRARLTGDQAGRDESGCGPSVFAGLGRKPPRAPKVTVTRKGDSLCQKGCYQMALLFLFLCLWSLYIS